jgi:hypothetical protein
MTRALYRCLVWLHPPAFRREFSDEMLCIYDETAPAGSVAPLFLDGFVSLARQWVLRSGYWKIPAALAGALFQILIGGALALRMGHHGAPSTRTEPGAPELAALIRMAALTAVGLLAAVIFLVFWWRKLARRIGV